MVQAVSCQVQMALGVYLRLIAYVFKVIGTTYRLLVMGLTYSSFTLWTIINSLWQTLVTKYVLFYVIMH